MEKNYVNETKNIKISATLRVPDIQRSYIYRQYLLLSILTLWQGLRQSLSVDAVKDIAVRERAVNVPRERPAAATSHKSPVIFSLCTVMSLKELQNSILYNVSSFILFIILRGVVLSLFRNNYCMYVNNKQV